MCYRYCVLACAIFTSFASLGQHIEEAVDSSALVIAYEAYMDFHYTADFNHPQNNIRPFNSNPVNVNQFGMAYTYASAAFEYKKLTATAAFHTGEIVSVMYAGEDYLNKFIRELSVRYRVTNSMEVEAGIFPAIYGAETFINKDNFHATRAVMTDFAPDFEAGFRIKYKYNQYLRATFQITNGWQVIKDNNNYPGFGMVHIFDKPDKLLLNYGIFVGKEVYISKNAMNQPKFYNNFFGRIHMGQKWIVAPMVDYGMIVNPNTNQWDEWYAMGGSLRYAITNQWGFAARYEYVHDPNQIINEVITNTPNGFQMKGTTLTLEYLPAPQVTFRLESRLSRSLDPIYPNDTGANEKTDFFVMGSIAIQLKNSAAVKMRPEPGLKDVY
ncbi:MAG: outer membrane beta-barrel protein [Bacteroidetes bacterium]|nr:outer membrane beta-barrel protein [Bacteroidota bacterium]